MRRMDKHRSIKKKKITIFVHQQAALILVRETLEARCSQAAVKRLSFTELSPGGKDAL
jgi:lipase chaperone LimK